MCGIAGILNFSGTFPVLKSVRNMTDALRHRGPDDEGYLVAETKTGRVDLFGGNDTPQDVFACPLPYAPKSKIDHAKELEQVPQIALGHRRLSIIDLSPSGHQPMCNSKGTLWIVYNGEIYNYIELRDELESAGYGFHSHSDTEVLLGAYEHWGAGALNRFVGMFAFAILDLLKKKLFLARDFFGIKPLYYTMLPAGFAFASEIKALLELPAVSRRVNAQRVYEYLRLSLTDHGEETLFSQIHQVPAAHFLELSLDHPEFPKSERYWDIEAGLTSGLSFHEASDRVKNLFLDNVNLHLRSDVPVGSALSGGMDSSSIVMAMRKLRGNAADLHTFSYIADHGSLSEERWVDLIGASSGATVHKVRFDSRELTDRLDRLVYVQDEPFASTSILAQNSVFRLARENGITVMLDGQGADELFGGYGSHLEARLASLLRNARFPDAFRLLRRARRSPGVRWWNLAGRALVPLLPGAAQAISRRVAGRQPAPGWLNLKWFAEREVLLRPVQRNEDGDGFRQQLHQTLSKTMLPMLLRYEDRNSMAFSIESRVPFLTPDLVHAAFSLPGEYLISKDGLSKAVFRSAMRGMVPDSILDRRDKIAFSTPEPQWLMALRPWVEKTIQAGAAEHVECLNYRVIEKDWPLLLRGGEAFDGRLWRWINLILWAQRFAVVFD